MWCLTIHHSRASSCSSSSKCVFFYACKMYSCCQMCLRGILLQCESECIRLCVFVLHAHMQNAFRFYTGRRINPRNVGAYRGRGNYYNTWCQCCWATWPHPPFQFTSGSVGSTTYEVITSILYITEGHQIERSGKQTHRDSF